MVLDPDEPDLEVEFADEVDLKLELVELRVVAREFGPPNKPLNNDPEVLLVETTVLVPDT